MSLMTKLTSPAARPPLFKAPAIAAQLADAEGRISALEARHREAALEAVSGNSPAATDLGLIESVESELTQTRQRITRLRAAHTAALEHDERERRRQVAALQATQVRAVRSHLNARDAAAEALSKALAEACAQWKVLIERSAKARAANPVGGQWPHGSVCDFGELKRLVEQELFRIGGDPDLGNPKSFPGANAHDLTLVHNPSAIPPLTDTLRQSSEHVLATLTGKEPE